MIVNYGARATEDTKGKIVEYLWFLKKEGYAESTITRRVRLLKTISKRGANLLDPESTKQVIAEQKNWKPTTKEHSVTAYTSFLRMLGREWKKPRYKRVRKMPFIPYENEVNELIAGCNKKTCAFLKLLKETGMRSGEAWMLEWIDLDFEHKTVSITPEKGSNPRVLPLPNELMLYSVNYLRNQTKYLMVRSDISDVISDYKEKELQRSLTTHE